MEKRKQKEQNLQPCGKNIQSRWQSWLSVSNTDTIFHSPVSEYIGIDADIIWENFLRIL